LWEAAVKSAKSLLLKTTAAATLTYEELTTVLVEIEAILNSRPIAPTDNLNDGKALTPGHLLIGQAMIAMPDVTHSSEKHTYAKRWQLISHLKGQFWTSFRKDFMSELQSRVKWATPQRNIKVGEIVVVHEDNLPPQKWLLGRIDNVITGKDGMVRVVDVKTKNGIIRRAIHKLAPLPGQSETEFEAPSSVQRGRDV